MTGFINVNKICGVSSAREVAIIKKITGSPCGHMGTLDPMACGVLPIAVGNATRLFNFFLSKRKTYVAEFMFGIETDTLDTTGKILCDGGRVPCESEIINILPQFLGDLNQIPPIYSAKSINGERGYNRARRGEKFEIAPKHVNIGEFSYMCRVSENTFRFRIECGSGTYIRSLARDLGKALNSSAVMSALTRTQSGMFKIENAVKTSELTADNINKYLIKTDDVLPFERVTLKGEQEKRFLNGVPYECSLPKGEYIIYLSDGSFYGVGTSDGATMKSRLKLC